MKIICIGRNYVEHAKELGNEVPNEPVIFMKPDSAVMRQVDKFYIPDWTQDVHHEIEVVIKINRLGKNIEERFAHKYYDQFSLGIDFTARDVQAKLKAKGLPWEKAKAFDRSAVIGHWLDVKSHDLKDLSFSLKRNDEMVQDGNTSLMIHSIDQIIAHVSQFFTLKIGDLIFTGTPKGVGPVHAGDKLCGFVGEQQVLKVDIR